MFEFVCMKQSAFDECILQGAQNMTEAVWQLGRKQSCICNPEFYGGLVYKFNKIIANPNFINLFIHIVNRFKRAGCTLDIMRQTACLVLTQSLMKAMLHSLVARRWFRPQTQ